MNIFQYLALLFLCGLIQLLTFDTTQAETKATPQATSPTQKIQKYNGPAQVQTTVPPQVKNATSKTLKIPYDLCADLKASLELTQGNNGLVAISATVTNLGNVDFILPAMAELTMTVAYAPTYDPVWTKVIETLAKRPIPKLKAGESFVVKTSYQIPNFGGWESGTVKVNAQRIFILRALKPGGSAFLKPEDCRPLNNYSNAAVNYVDLKPGPGGPGVKPPW